MPDPAILFVKPKAISAKDKKALSAVGVIVVEVADPNDVKLVKAATEFSAAELTGGPLLRAAAMAINDCGSSEVKTMFAKAICAAIEASAPSNPD